MDPVDVLGRLAGADGVVVDQVGGDGGGLVVVTRVVHESRERLVGELFGLDEVAATELERIDADLAGQRIHRPLDGVRRLGATGAAVGIGRGERGEHPGAREVVGLGQVVDAGVEERAEDGDAGCDQLQIGAHVGGEAHTDGGELAAGVGCQLDVLDLATALDAGDGVLGAGLVPAHRPAVLAGERDAQQLLGVHVELGAEATADRRCHDAQLVLGDAERDRDHHLEHMGDLGRGVQREVTAERLGYGDDGPRLHRHRDQPLLHVALGDGERGVVERLLDGAVGLLDEQVPGVRRVGAEVGVDQHTVAQCVFEVGDRLQRVVGDVDRLDGVVRDRIAVGEHHGHTVADEVGGVDGDRMVRRVQHVLGDRPGARHGCGPEVGEVGAGVHRAHARHGRCGTRCRSRGSWRGRTDCAVPPCGAPRAPSCRW